MPISYTEVRRRPPLPSADVRRPMSLAGDSYTSLSNLSSSSSSSISRPAHQYSSARAPSILPSSLPSGALQARSRSTWAPSSSSTTARVPASFPATSGRPMQSFQRRSISAPPLMTSSYDSGSTYRRTARRPFDPDLDDEDVFSKSRSRYVPTSYTPLARYVTAAGHRAALRQQASRYADDDTQDDDYSRRSLSELRAKTSAMQDAVDKHKQLIDRYRTAPTLNGPSTAASAAGAMSTDEVDRRYANIISNYRRDTTPTTYRPGSSTSSVSAAASYSAPKSTARPEVSDARRKLRKILSESKGNRNYFD